MRHFFNARINLIGDYSGRRDEGISYKFRFNRDRTYFYCAEQMGRWKLAHQGLVRLAESKLAGTKFMVARFEPRQMDLDPGPVPIATLAERALLTNRIEEYKVYSYNKQHAHNPKLQVEHVCFSIPDPDGSSFSVSWEIEKIV